MLKLNRSHNRVIILINIIIAVNIIMLKLIILLDSHCLLHNRGFWTFLKLRWLWHVGLFPSLNSFRNDAPTGVVRSPDFSLVTHTIPSSVGTYLMCIPCFPQGHVSGLYDPAFPAMSDIRQTHAKDSLYSYPLLSAILFRSEDLIMEI